MECCEARKVELVHINEAYVSLTLPDFGNCSVFLPLRCSLRMPRTFELFMAKGVLCGSPTRVRYKFHDFEGELAYVSCSRVAQNTKQN